MKTRTDWLILGLGALFGAGILAFGIYLALEQLRLL